MNTCAALNIKERFDSDALALLRLDRPNERVSFRELGELSRKAQMSLLSWNVKAGDSILLMALPSAELYAASVAALALGARLVFVEPFMSIKRIEHAIELVKPKLFLTTPLGFVWGARVAAIRKISCWKNIRSLFKATAEKELILNELDGDEPGIYTFTTGTTGKPKGVVRTHRKLTAQNKIISAAIGVDQFKKPDLAIFANLVLANLAMGRGTLLVPHAWDAKSILNVSNLSSSEKPETLSCGPAFLKKLIAMKEFEFSNLKSIHVGGALSDCSVFEKAFQTIPDSRFIHVYGSTEAEPVCLSDARQAVQRSKEANLYQTLFIGEPIVEVNLSNETDSAWVSGGHVCEFYLEDDLENKTHKRKDHAGIIWHKMGDRLHFDDGYWYRGRSSQDEKDFLLEQKIYWYLQSSASFVYSDNRGEKTLIGEHLIGRQRELKNKFPQLSRVVEVPIKRDLRHRARIDRAQTINKGAKWLAG